MNYIDFNGKELSAEGGLEFLEKNCPYDKWPHNEARPEGRRVLTTDRELWAECGKDVFQHAKTIVASEPSFLNKSYHRWTLSYIDKAFELLSEGCDNDNRTREIRTYLGNYDYLEFIDNPDAISVTRLIHTMDFVFGLCSETANCRDYFGINKTKGADKNWIEIALIRQKESNYPQYRFGDESKSFKTLMTKNVYKDTDVIITIPAGEELVSESLRGREMIIESGAKFEGTMIRFYKTDLFWSNRANFEFYPTIKGNIEPTITETPLFAMTLEMAKGLESTITRNIFGPSADFYGAHYSINAFIPLHWISHILIDGEYHEITDNPTPVPCSYDPTSGVMPMIEFLKGFMR
jgi:hypothetical protein